MKAIYTKSAPEPIGPYSQAVEVNGIYYFSGQVGIDSSTGQLINDTIETETIQVMTNIKSLLDEIGLDFSNIVKSSIFLKDLNDFNTVNEIYAKYFEAPYPARECVQVSRLPKDANIEISVIVA